jgi:hypothetical protein
MQTFRESSLVYIFHFSWFVYIGRYLSLNVPLAHHKPQTTTYRPTPDRVLLHLGEAPSALTVDFDPSTVKKPRFSLGAWKVRPRHQITDSPTSSFMTTHHHHQVPTHHANKLSGTLHALSRDWSSDGEEEEEEEESSVEWNGEMYVSVCFGSHLSLSTPSISYAPVLSLFLLSFCPCPLSLSLFL